jgi:DNA uptake protein ComE-like DNA-binding protein
MHRLISLAALSTLLACGGASRDADTTAAPATPAPDTSARVGQSAAGVATQQGLADPNSVSKEQLLALQVDAATADALIAGRPYADMLAVDRVLASRMSEAQRKTIYARLFKPIDLNTAKGEEILLIPGVGPRMRHEFEEYRPYRNIEQFRREIGKYVDKTEVARLEQYVSIK